MPVLITTVYSFFAGAALSFFVTGATSLFLSSFEKDMLPLSFIIAGVLVWLTGLLFSRYQNRIKYTKLLFVGVLFLLISVILFLSIYISTKSIILIFVLYAWIRIFTYIQSITFWGMIGRLFSMRQGKRVFGLITGGEVLAAILSFFSVPFLLKLISTEDLLIVSGIFLILAFGTLVFIVRKYGNKLSDVKPRMKTSEATKSPGFMSNRYYKYFFLIAFFPIFAQFFVDFIFQAQAKVEFPIRESLTAFVGVFFGVGSVVEFILKTFVSGRTLNKYGIQFGLLAFPVMLAFSFALASIFGFFYGAATLFFSFVSLGRLFTRAVRTSFNDPSTQLLYQPLPPDERIVFQNKIESGPKAFAGIAAGVLLFAFSKFSWFTLVYFSIFLLIFIFLWYRSGIEIFKEYKKLLQNILSRKKDIVVQSETEKIFDYLKSKSDQNNIKSDSIVGRLSQSVFPYRSDIILEKETFEKQKLKLKDVIELVHSENPTNRKKAAELFADHSIYKTEVFLNHLLTDEDYNVRSAAILTAGKLKEPELFNYLFSNLRISEYHNVVVSAIIYTGPKIIPYLADLFYKIEHLPDIQSTVVKIIGIIGGKEAKSVLMNWITYPNKAVSQEVIEALTKHNYIAKRNEAIQLSNRMEEEIENYVYAAACLVDLQELGIEEDIMRALLHEKRDKKERIFTILSILYDPVAVDLIQANIENEEESGNFALEIADFVISELHKPLLFPIFEDLPDFEIINRYKYIFPQEKLEMKDRLKDIVNTENYKAGIYTKTLALNLLTNYPSDDVKTVLKASPVHPNVLVRETSAITLFYQDSQLFENQTNLLKSKIKNLSDLKGKISVDHSQAKLLILEKLKLIRSLNLFSDFGFLKLTGLAENSIDIFLKVGDSMLLEPKDFNDFYVCVYGMLVNENSKTEIMEGDIFRFDLSLGIKQTLTAEEPCFILKGKIWLLNTLFTDSLEFVKKLTEKMI
jgi:ATP:ADP antiporter, AAA family